MLNILADHLMHLLLKLTKKSNWNSIRATDIIMSMLKSCWHSIKNKWILFKMNTIKLMSFYLDCVESYYASFCLDNFTFHTQSIFNSAYFD